MCQISDFKMASTESLGFQEEIKKMILALLVPMSGENPFLVIGHKTTGCHNNLYRHTVKIKAHDQQKGVILDVQVAGPDSKFVCILKPVGMKAEEYYRLLTQKWGHDYFDPTKVDVGSQEKEGQKPGVQKVFALPAVVPQDGKVVTATVPPASSVPPESTFAGAGIYGAGGVRVFGGLTKRVGLRSGLIKLLAEFAASDGTLESLNKAFEGWRKANRPECLVNNNAFGQARRALTMEGLIVSVPGGVRRNPLFALTEKAQEMIRIVPAPVKTETVSSGSVSLKAMADKLIDANRLFLELQELRKKDARLGADYASLGAQIKQLTDNREAVRVSMLEVGQKIDDICKRLGGDQGIAELQEALRQLGVNPNPVS